MAAAAILDFEKMLPLFKYLTNHHQSWRDCYETEVEHIPNIENYANTKIRNKCCDFLTI
jgi:hypothetical protein